MDTPRTVAEATESVLELVTSLQGHILDANREAADRAADLVPSIPSIPSIPSMPAMPSMPWGDGTPAPHEVAEQALDFQVKLAEANKRFAVQLIEAWAPVAGKVTASTGE